MKRPATVGIPQIELVDIAREVEEALGTQEEPLRDLGRPFHFQMRSQRRLRRLKAVAMVAIATFRIEAAPSRQRLESVDLPEPFSPTKNVTEVSNEISMALPAQSVERLDARRALLRKIAREQRDHGEK